MHLVPDEAYNHCAEKARGLIPELGPIFRAGRDGKCRICHTCHGFQLFGRGQSGVPRAARTFQILHIGVGQNMDVSFGIGPLVV